MDKVIILGSSRKNGETKKVVSELVRIAGWDVIDLKDYNFSHFDYEHSNRGDDFLELIRRIIGNYEVLVFATPVYWYSMSGIMKTFFDRITDLLRYEKETGRKLRGKHLAVISSSSGENLGDDFWIPFKRSAEYLGMNYITGLHTYQDQMQPELIKEFSREIEEVSLSQKN